MELNCGADISQIAYFSNIDLTVFEMASIKHVTIFLN